MVGSVRRPGTQAGWLGCVFWALVSILFKPGPWPQTSRKPFITLYREGNVGKNQADHVAPSLAAESWPAPSLLLQPPRPGNTHCLAQTSFHTPELFLLSLSFSNGFSVNEGAGWMEFDSQTKRSTFAECFYHRNNHSKAALVLSVEIMDDTFSLSSNVNVTMT